MKGGSLFYPVVACINFYQLRSQYKNAVLKNKVKYLRVGAYTLCIPQAYHQY